MLWCAVADSGAEGRIKDLKRRLELAPGSRLFVGLAEEYRKSGRLKYVLEKFETEPVPVQVVYAQGRLMSSRVRAFADEFLPRYVLSVSFGISAIASFIRGDQS